MTSIRATPFTVMDPYAGAANRRPMLNTQIPKTCQNEWRMVRSRHTCAYQLAARRIALKEAEVANDSGRTRQTCWSRRQGRVASDGGFEQPGIPIEHGSVAETRVTSLRGGGYLRRAAVKADESRRNRLQQRS